MSIQRSTAQPVWALAAAAAVVLAAHVPTHAQDNQKMQHMQQQIDMLLMKMQEKDKQIESLQGQVQRLHQQTDAGRTKRNGDALDTMLRDLERREGPADDSIVSASVGGANFRLTDISVAVLTVVGGSSVGDEMLESLQGGGHDPNRNGFTLQQAELSLGGAVDPYFRGEAHINFFEGGVELEEAFAQTTSLPWGLQVEAGYFFTEFGRLNPQHAHVWDWIDQPVINTRLFGGDGMRGTGARVGWLTPLPWYSELHFGAQNATGDFMPSFRGEGLGHAHGEEEEEEEHAHFEEGIGGRPIVERETNGLEDMVFLMRWVNGFDITDEWSAQVGASALWGGNNAGMDTQTWIYGGDFVVKWRPRNSMRGYPFVTWQTEIMRRSLEADPFFDDDDPMEVIDIPGGTIRDWGIYTQVLYGFAPQWAAGVRYEYASGSGDSYEEGEAIDRSEDPFRGDRHRFSPLLMWRPTEFSRLRLQYNYDRADFIEDDHAHTIWFGFDVLFGSHPAHSY